MSEHRRTAVEAGRAIADALRARGLPHALGGALALGDDDERVRRWDDIVARFGDA